MSWVYLYFRLSVLFAVCSYVGLLPGGEAERPVDIFAEIAALKQDYADRNLVDTPPPELNQRFLPVEAGEAAAFRPGEKITTAAQLTVELKRLRDLYDPFLKDLAPKLEETRLRQPLERFDWRIETDADRDDFAATLAGAGKWEQVVIPHYGPPMGRAVTYYRTTFELTPEMFASGALFVCFKGVDYKAHVFVNGALVGSHEGYFAPFRFEFTRHARPGKNVLLVKVENDFIMLGNSADLGFLPGGTEYQGDKIFACGGPCWDEPVVGWHECPPGMGIWQDVTIEARPRVHLHDIFVRPLDTEGNVEVWVELFNCDPPPVNMSVELSVFGQNFQAEAVPAATHPVGNIMAGVNCYKIPLSIPNPKLWSLDSPWLYQVQVKLLDGEGKTIDTAKRQFGLRTFRMEYVSAPKGRMYLNGRGIKLRGANTMGAFQRCVMHKDWDQLIDDILLAKITNMNYIRLTQTPVQPEIYEYCDRLGLMLQTDLPLFGNVKRNQFCEVVRQAEEMERLVRSHPSNIMVTYINEPFPNASDNPQRNLTREELTRMFEAADAVVRMANPNRVIKTVDGDYDPPGPGLPDNHCYCGWYNGHGVDMGRLHKGYWQRVKPGWVYGCGEFGAEGLDPVALMRKRYPAAWLPQSPEEEKKWTPNRIPAAQTGRMHYDFFETPTTLAEWVEQGQQHQAWVTRIMTEAYRRDRRMHSFAIHLFIDNYPSGWMKTIMDCERGPKPAWFVYRDALTPLAVNLRSDRRAFFAGESIEVETWVCNDLDESLQNATLRYQLEHNGRMLQSGSTAAEVPALDAAYQGSVRFQAPDVDSRTMVTVRLGLFDAAGKLLHDTALFLDVFPHDKTLLRRICLVGPSDGRAARLAKELAADVAPDGQIDAADAILIDDYQAFDSRRADIARAVQNGAKAIFLSLPAGKYRIAETNVEVGGTPTRLHFVSRDTGHSLVDGFGPEDFKFWHNSNCGYPTPLLNEPAFQATDWKPVLLSHNRMAAGTLDDGKGQWVVCQIDLAGRIEGNPPAAIFARRLLSR